ncbi:MAG: transposase [Bacteroidia bacterium]|jgi:transposase
MERKVKYSYKFKLRCVEEVLTKNQSIESYSISKGFCESNLRKWIRVYKKHGKSGLLPRTNQAYSIDFKMGVLQTLNRDSLTLDEACQKFNIPSASTIIKWRDEYSKGGVASILNKPRGRPKIMEYKRAKKKSKKPLTREEELLLENESLRAELDLLKKLQALIQAEQYKKRKPY